MGQDEHRIPRHCPRETHGARGQAGNGGLGPWTRRPSVALAERMRKGGDAGRPRGACVWATPG